MPELTYLLLNLGFLLPVLIALTTWAAIRHRRNQPVPASALALNTIALLMITLIFNNLIIGFGLVDYDATLITGIRLGLIPIEDFAYAIVAAVFVPLVFVALSRGRRDER